jgi:hypothetical protein
MHGQVIDREVALDHQHYRVFGRAEIGAAIQADIAFGPDDAAGVSAGDGAHPIGVTGQDSAAPQQHGARLVAIVAGAGGESGTEQAIAVGHSGRNEGAVRSADQFRAVCRSAGRTPVPQVGVADQGCASQDCQAAAPGRWVECAKRGTFQIEAASYGDRSHWRRR